jgi:hypothetical protein
VLAFLGINASQADPRRSMCSHHYLAMYLVVAGPVLVGALLSVALWVQHRRGARHLRVTAPRPRWTTTADAMEPMP